MAVLRWRAAGAAGGAVSICSGTVNITNSTFFNNSAASNGGALNTNFAANFSLLNDTIASNGAADIFGRNRRQLAYHLFRRTLKIELGRPDPTRITLQHGGH